MTIKGTDTASKQVAEPTYPWARFWVPRDGIVNLSDAGFLLDPSEYPLQSPGAVQLAALQEYKALVLLGEPGIGKSTTLKEEADRVDAVGGSTVSIYENLRSFSSDALLHKRIFESEKFRAWKNGNSHLFLHLDSLDEALLRINSIANLLASVLPELPSARMSIRIACRTAVWPANILEVALTRIWANSARVYELAPLRRRDIFIALEADGITLEAFMRELFAAQAVPFAIKPLTLTMLLKIYRGRGNLPRSNVDLYRLGCLALCEEQSKS